MGFSCKQRMQDILSRFDIFRVPVGFYFKGEQSYHSPLVTVISMLVLALSFYLAYLENTPGTIGRTVTDFTQANSIQFKNKIVISLQQDGLQQFVVRYACATRTPNGTFLNAFYRYLVNTTGQTYQLDNYEACPLQTQTTGQNTLQIEVHCVTNCGVSDWATRGTVSVTSTLFDYQQNALLDSTFRAPVVLTSQPTQYTVYVSVNTLLTYSNWLSGSFAWFPTSQQSLQVSNLRDTDYNPNKAQLLISVENSGKKITIQRDYPSCLNYGLAALAIYWLGRFGVNFLFLKSFSRNLFYYQLGVEGEKQDSENMSMDKSESGPADSQCAVSFHSRIKKQLRVICACLLPQFVTSSHFQTEKAVIRQGKQLLSLQKLLNSCFLLTQFDEEMQPAMKAEIEVDQIAKRDCESMIQGSDIIVVSSSVKRDIVVSMPAPGKSFFSSAKSNNGPSYKDQQAFP